MVDDEAAIRQAIVRQLERAGHSAFEARDGAEALEQLSGADFDLVISDVVMPVMGGIELARQLAGRGCSIPGLLISGYAPEPASAPSENRWPLLQKHSRPTRCSTSSTDYCMRDFVEANSAGLELTAARCAGPGAPPRGLRAR